MTVGRKLVPARGSLVEGAPTDDAFGHQGDLMSQARDHLGGQPAIRRSRLERRLDLLGDAEIVRLPHEEPVRVDAVKIHGLTVRAWRGSARNTGIAVWPA